MTPTYKYALGRLSIGLVAACLFFCATYADAATLSLRTASPTVSVGDIFTVRVALTSNDQAINTAEGILQFPTDVVEVLSLSKSSVFTLWVEEPSFSNQSSRVSFNGGLPNPGFQGADGTVLTVTFRAKHTGTATLSIANGVVRANDGLGTDVLQSATGATIVVVEPTTTPTSAPSPETPAPEQAPKISTAEQGLAITSSTHSNQDGWYTQTQAVLHWSLPSGTDAIQTLLSKKKGETPGILYRPAIKQKTIDNLDEGVWYFSLRAHTNKGWGSISTYKLQIDTTPPVLSGITVRYDHKDKSLLLTTAALDTLSPRPASLEGAASDALSGLSTLKVLIDGAVVATIVPKHLSGDTYRVPVTLEVGEHSAMVRASDRAGNETDSDATTFEIVRPPSLFEGVVVSISSLPVVPLVAIFLFLLLFLMNIALWRKLYRFERRGRKGSGILKIQREVYQKLFGMKKDLQRQGKDIERMKDKKGMNTDDALYLKKIRAHLGDIEAYITQKIDDIEKRS